MKIDKENNKTLENHRTAAWSDIEETDAESNVSHPSLAQTKRAKAYVDENQK